MNLATRARAGRARNTPTTLKISKFRFSPEVGVVRKMSIGGIGKDVTMVEAVGVDRSLIQEGMFNKITLQKVPKF